MEIISGDAAYRITEEFRQDALNKVIDYVISANFFPL